MGELEPINPYNTNGRGADLARKRTALVRDPELEPDRPGRSASQWFDDLFERDDADLLTSQAEVLCAAWRLCRYHAVVRGVAHPDLALSDMSLENGDPWVEPHPVNVASPASRARGRLAELPPLSLLPPDVPEELQGDDGNAVVGYNPAEHDEDLMEWLQWMASLSHALKPGHHELADIGFRPLLDPVLCRFTFPAPEVIISFEQVLLDEVLELFIERGQARSIAHLRRAYGFTRPEAIATCRLAAGRAAFRNSRSAETDKAVMVLRLDHLYAKAVASFDFRLAHQVMKTKAIVQGLAAIGVDGEIEDKEDTIKAVMARRDKIAEVPTSPVHLQIEESSTDET